MVHDDGGSFYREAINSEIPLPSGSVLREESPSLSEFDVISLANSDDEVVSLSSDDWDSVRENGSITATATVLKQFDEVNDKLKKHYLFDLYPIYFVIADGFHSLIPADALRSLTPQPVDEHLDGIFRLNAPNRILLQALKLYSDGIHGDDCSKRAANVVLPIIAENVVAQCKLLSHWTNISDSQAMKRTVHNVLQFRIACNAGESDENALVFHKQESEALIGGSNTLRMPIFTMQINNCQDGALSAFEQEAKHICGI